MKFETFLRWERQI